MPVFQVSSRIVSAPLPPNQQTVDPYSVSLWMRISDGQPEKSSAIEMIRVADDDPFIAYLLNHPGLVEIDRLQLDTSIVQKLRGQRAEILLPLAS